MWEHLSLTLRSEGYPSGEKRPFVSAGQVQMEKIRELGHLGFECVGVTTLDDGALFLMFKRPLMSGNTPAEIDDSDGVGVGLYI